ncbi:DKNYY domain-containing protein [Chryseobacterium sp. MIQD13]|uniref:DKNYY domain-containing protein n=1 Tax=Chryseobacterium sp. MIQD13 TaxID=3422310 RepID=UPI003D2CCC4E
MKSKHFLISLFIFGCSLFYGQDTNILLVENFRNDSLLSFPLLKVLQSPVYIVNKSNIIFQKDKNTRKIIKADLSTFRLNGSYNRDDVFAFDKNGIFVNGDFIKTDTIGFVPFGKTMENKWLWKNKKGVFLNTTQLKGINPHSFERLKTKRGDAFHGYFKDEKYVYYFDKVVLGADVKKAFGVDSECFSDGYYYYKGKRLTFNNLPVQYVNAYLHKTAKEVFYNWDKKVYPEIDAESLERLSDNYAKDKNHIYYHNQALPIDKADFNQVKIWEIPNASYITDGKKIFLGNKEQENVKKEDFGILPSASFFYDNGGISLKVWNSRADSLTVKKVSAEEIEMLRKKNYNIVGRYFVLDNQVYDFIQGIYYKNIPQEVIAMINKGKHDLVNIDGKTSLTTSYDYLLYKTDDKIYWNGKETQADINTFERLNGLFNIYKDKNNIYTYSREKGLFSIKGIDVMTARGQWGFLIDKDYLYNLNYRLLNNKDLDMVAILEGEPGDCGGGPTRYLFKNSDGFWIVTSESIRNIGKTLPVDINDFLDHKSK